MRWTHRRGSKVEEVSARHSSATSISRRGARRPPDTIDASVPESISRYSQIDEPAAHETRHFYHLANPSVFEKTLGQKSSNNRSERVF